MTYSNSESTTRGLVVAWASKLRSGQSATAWGVAREMGIIGRELSVESALEHLVKEGDLVKEGNYYALPPTADIRVLRTAFKFDIVENSSGNIIARDVEDDRPVRWFIPKDGSDPVACPASMREAVASMTAEHCGAPAIGRPGQSLHIYYVNPFEY